MPISKEQSKKLYTKAEKHASSAQHRLATEKEKGRYGMTTVMEKVIVQSNRQTQSDESVMRDIFRVAYFLFAAELPHTTTWRPLMSTVVAVENTGRIGAYLKEAASNARHLSSTTITEILDCYGEAIFQASEEELSTVNEFAILVDECTDVNEKEMLSICVRYIKNDQVVERFVSVTSIVSTKADVIYGQLLVELKKHHLDSSKIMAAAFDGASNFSGNKAGVQTLLKQQSPNFVYVHCRSHALQLCQMKACQSIPEIKRIISVWNKLFSLFRGSAKRSTVLYDIEVAIDQQSHKLVQAGTTQWLSHEASIDVVCKHYAAICLALEHVYQDAGICQVTQVGSYNLCVKTVLCFSWQCCPKF